MRGRAGIVGTVVVVAVCVTARTVGAQTVPPRYVEYRADGIVTRGFLAQAGLGVVIPAGVYARMSIDAAAGPAWSGGAVNPSGRVDAVGRFLLDPFRETPVAVSLGGGVSVPYSRGDAHVRPYLTAVIDVEGRKRGALTPAVQVGLGGGARIGVVLRRSPGRWR
jgi:hypothetical protein